MRSKLLSLVFLSTLALISGCGKDDAKPGTSNPSTGAPTQPPINQPAQGGGNNNCYCDECGCYILYNNGSYMDVDSCNAIPQQTAPQQQYPQNYPQQGYGYPQQNYYPQQYQYPQQNYYPQQRYGYPQQTFYFR